MLSEDHNRSRGFTRLAGAKHLRQFMCRIPDREYYWRKVESQSVGASLRGRPECDREWRAYSSDL
jgi:hypothetical protein